MITILITLGGGGVWPMITIDYVRGWGGLESRNHDYVILKRSLSVAAENWCIVSTDAGQWSDWVSRIGWRKARDTVIA